MHLITPLVSGIANAGNGSAKITRRGTTVLATLYSSFEGDSFSSASLDNNDRVILDDYGRAVVYVAEVCDVEVFDGSGTLQVSFTAGVSAAAVEVRSEAFTGRHYDASESSGVNQPTTLAAVLNLWQTVRGNPDWRLTTSADFPVVVVTDDAFGATGDGVTDDSAAISAAILAANNGARPGIVYFPPGNYRIATRITLPGGVTLAGSSTSDSGASVNTTLTMDGAGDEMFVFSGGTGTQLKLVSLHLAAAQSRSVPLIDLTGVVGARLEMHNCAMAATFSAEGLIKATSASNVVRLSYCTLSASGGYCVVNGTVTLDHCTLTSTGDATVVVTANALQADACAFTGGFGTGPYTGNGILYGNELFVRGCSFRPLHESGTLSCIKFNSTATAGSVIGCSFLAAFNGTADTVGMELGSYTSQAKFVESGNRFPLEDQYDSRAFTAYSYTAHADCVTVVLQTRAERSIVITNNAGSVDIPTDQYGTVIVKSTSVAADLQGARPPHGATGRVLFYHPSGGAGNVELTTGFFPSTTVVTADTGTYGFDYVCAQVNATLRMMVFVNGFAFGAGA